jgi:glycine/D-amino acid oxidase-like deaminating enzyme/nitrite reductase/ring-hydroxylating ferredoxin subunit
MKATESLWAATAEHQQYPTFGRDATVDVAIVGGGITGLTAAVLLASEGKRVAVLEAREIGSGVTGRSSAHLTAVLDTRYQKLEADFGFEGAQLAMESTLGAIAQVEALCRRFAIECEFTRVPGYLFTERDEGVEELEREFGILQKIGMPVERTSLPLSLAAKQVLRYPNQAQFHPLAYVLALARHAAKLGAQIHENSRVCSIDEGEPCRVQLESGALLTAERVILATHNPLNAVLLQTRVAQYRSYIVTGPIAGDFPPGLFWDTEDPYHYVRSRRGDVTELIVGGGDHKTGTTEDADGAFKDVLAFATRLGLYTATRHWSAQVVEPADGLPFIGPNTGSKHVYVATGYSGDGLTFGTLAAQILRDACLDKPNRFAGLYAPKRVNLAASLPSLLGENIDFPMHLLSDWTRAPDTRDLDEVGRGEGKIVRVKGQRLAVFRDDGGAIHAVSAICTHLGCHVAFNPTERTWDCPCHGSRFDVDGKVIDGPATRALRRPDTLG